MVARLPRARVQANAVRAGSNWRASSPEQPEFFFNVTLKYSTEQSIVPLVNAGLEILFDIDPRE
jgi:hypothetical protein